MRKFIKYAIASNQPYTYKLRKMVSLKKHNKYLRYVAPLISLAINKHTLYVSQVETIRQAEMIWVTLLLRRYEENEEAICGMENILGRTFGDCDLIASFTMRISISCSIVCSDDVTRPEKGYGLISALCEAYIICLEKCQAMFVL